MERLAIAKQIGDASRRELYKLQKTPHWGNLVIKAMILKAVKMNNGYLSQAKIDFMLKSIVNPKIT